jgi:spore maturation protein CgeB
LYTWASAEFSTYDVARGYRGALARQGLHEVRDYKLFHHFEYHARAIGLDRAANVALLARLAAENILVEAVKHGVDRVVIISGMACHPDAIWLLRRVGIPVTILFTESPYDDEAQHEYHDVYPEAKAFTNERISANGRWSYLAHAYDPHVHAPTPPPSDERYDVLMIGTLWRERIRFFERVNWTGINAKFIGTWVAPPAPDASPLGRYFEDGCVHNVEAPGYYAAATICLNLHRDHPAAESLNPRTYELAACGAFQLSDRRAELDDVFGPARVAACGGDPSVPAIPTFTSPEDLEQQVRWWLGHPEERAVAVQNARACVQGHTFDARVGQLVGV